MELELRVEKTTTNNWTRRFLADPSWKLIFTVPYCHNGITNTALASWTSAEGAKRRKTLRLHRCLH
ncbi:hypothetical protein [Bartonella sp. CL46QHWL]|uniref:hypothetical protein n=1 Tax=Bartonella sp. CL46QHWL TaxID=3243534 RepID=UPI0035D00606